MVNRSTQKKLLNSGDPVNLLHNLNKSRKERRKQLYDEEKFAIMLQHNESKKYLMKCLKTGKVVKMEKFDFNADEVKSVIEVQMSKKQMNYQLFKEGLQEPGILKARKAAAMKRKKEKKYVRRQNAKARDLERRQKKEFREISGAEMDARYKIRNKKKQVHPKKEKRLVKARNRQRQIEEHKKEKQENQEKRRQFRESRAAKKERRRLKKLQIQSESLDVSDDVMSVKSVVFLYQIWRSRGVLDVIAATAQYANAMHFNVEYQEIYEVLVQRVQDLLSSDDVLKGKTQEIEMTEFKLDEEKYDIHSESFLEKASFLYDTILSSQLFKTISEIFIVITSMGLVPGDYIGKISSLFGRPQKMRLVDLLSKCLSVLSKLFTYGLRIFSGEKIMDIISADDPVQAALDRANLLLTYWPQRLYSGLPVDGCYEVKEYMKDIDDITELLTTLSKEVSPMDNRRHAIKHLERMCLNVSVDLKKNSRYESRIPPVCFIIAGPAGIGKSNMPEMIIRILCHVLGIEYKAGLMYVKGSATPYWDGYNPLTNPVIFMSELGSMSKSQAVKQGDPTLVELLSLVDKNPFPCNMAECSEKGRIYADPKLVLADCNNAGLHAKELMYSSGAVMRRFIFMHVEVKPEFCVEGGTALDVDKSFAAGGNLMDRYIFTFKKHYPSGNASLEKVLMRGNVYDAIEFIKETMTEHFRVNKELQNSGLYSFVDDHLSGEIKEIEIEAEDGDGETFVGKMLNLSAAVVSTGVELAVTSMLPNVKHRDQDFFITTNGTYWLLVWSFILFYSMFGNAGLMTMMVMSPLINFRGIVRTLIVARIKRQRKKLIPLQNKFKYLIGFDKFKPFVEGLIPYEYQILTGIVACIAGFKLYRHYTQPQNLTESSDFKCDSVFNEDVNTFENMAGCHFGKPRFKTKSHDGWNSLVPNSVIGLHKGTAEELYSCIVRNVYNVRLIFEDGRSVITTLVGVYSTKAIINTHALRGNDNFVLELSHSGRNDIPGFTVDISKEDYRIKDDLCLVNIKKKSFCDIRKHFVSGNTMPSVHAIINYRQVNAKVYNGFSVKDKGGTIHVKEGFHYKYENHENGMCGTPLVAQLTNDSSAIVGIHIGGSRNSADAFAMRVTRDDIESLHWDDQIFEVYSQASFQFGVFEPKRKSIFLHEPLHHLEYYGGTGLPVMLNKKANMHKTRLADGLDSFFADCLGFTRTEHYGVPVMKPMVKNGDWISPISVGLNKMNKPSKDLDKKVLARCVDEVVNRIVNGIEELKVDLHPITVAEAVNGVKCDDFTSRINVATGAGFGFEGKKSKYLIEIDDEIDNSMYREPIDEIKASLLNMMKAYRNHVRYGNIYSTEFKLEPRLEEKIKKGATRLFYKSQVDYLVLARMFLSPFYSLMVQHGFLFCTAVGINMHTEAQSLVLKLRSFSEFMIEGDYSGFDVSQCYDIALGAASIVSKVLNRVGYSEFAMDIVNGLLSDGLFPNIECFGDVFCRPGMQPSGKYATAEDNSLRGLLMLMYAWYKNENTKAKPFFDNVLPLLYGDDVIASVKKDVLCYYNNNTYQSMCEEYYGMKFTSAAKDDDLKEYLLWTEMSFLKRTFELHENRQRIEAKLNLNSVYKSLEWVIPSSDMTEEYQVLATIVSMCWELFFHSRDETHYVQMSEYLLHMYLKVYDVQDAFSYFPKYQELLERTEPGGTIQTESYYEQETCLSHLSSLLPYGNSNVHTFYDFVVTRKDYQRRAEQKILELNEMEEVCNKRLDELDHNEVPFSLEELRMHVSLRGHISNATMKRYVSILSEIEDLYQTKRVIDRLRRKQQKYVIYSESYDMRDGVINESLRDEKETVLDTAGTHAQELHKHIFTTLDQGQDHLLTLDDFFARPVEIADFNMPVGANVSLKFDVWDLYTLQPSVRAKLRNYAYLRGDLHVRIAISGSPFHYGRVMVSYQPQALRNTPLTNLDAAATVDTDLRPLLLNYLSQSPECGTMDVKANQPLDMHIPFIMTKPMGRLFNDSSLVLSGLTSYNDFTELGQLYFYTITPPLSVSATPSELGVQIYAWLTNVQLGVPTATQIEIITESGDEREVGPVEKTATFAADITGALSDIPVIGPLAKASSMVFTGIKGVAAWFGWSRPGLIANPSYVKNQPFSNGAVTIGVDTVKRLVFDPMQELHVDPRIVGVQDDELAIAAMVKRESYIDTFEWEATDQEMEVIYRSRVTPQLDTWYRGGVNTNVCQPSAMSFAAAPFQYWHGDIVFRFEIVCSNYHRGKIGIYFEPNVSQASLIDADLSLNKNFFRIIDIQETQSFEMCVEWAHPRAWASLAPATSSYQNNYSFSTSGAEFCNGYIGVVPFTQLQSPDDSTITVNVYVRSENMQYNHMSSINMPNDREEIGDIFTESGDVDPYEAKYSQDVTCTVLNPTSATNKDISLWHFGEQPMSFRAAMKRFVTTRRATAGPGVAGTRTLRAQFDVYPPPAPLIGGLSNATPTIFGYLRYAFLGMRGGMRKRLHAIADDVDMNLATDSRVVVTNGDASIISGSGAVFVSDFTSTSTTGSAQFKLDTMAGTEIEIPFYSSNYYVYAFADNMITEGVATGDMIQSWNKIYVANYEIADVTLDNYYVIEDSAVAEDFNFLRFNGAPYFTDPL